MTGSRGCRGSVPWMSEGFTLIEVLVSVVILSTGIVLVLSAFETSLVALSEARDALRASALIEMRLAEIRSKAAIGGDVSSSSGSFDSPYQAYMWRVVRESTGISHADRRGTNTLVQVTVTVGREGSPTEYEATSYVRIGS